MALIDSDGFAHVRLTVTDINASKTFYDTLFGWPVVIDWSTQAGDPAVRGDREKFYGGVIYQTPQSTLFGLRPVGTQRFDPDHTGLDHVSFAVPSYPDLQTIANALTSAGIPHGTVTDLTEAGIAILSIQDPDDINIELTAPLPS